jgi:hypothetical protein
MGGEPDTVPSTKLLRDRVGGDRETGELGEDTTGEDDDFERSKILQKPGAYRY